MEPQKPSIGRVVHFYTKALSCRSLGPNYQGPYAATVSFVHEGTPTDMINLAYVDHGSQPGY